MHKNSISIPLLAIAAGIIFLAWPLWAHTNPECSVFEERVSDTDFFTVFFEHSGYVSETDVDANMMLSSEFGHHYYSSMQNSFSTKEGVVSLDQGALSSYLVRAGSGDLFLAHAFYGRQGPGGDDGRAHTYNCNEQVYCGGCRRYGCIAMLAGYQEEASGNSEEDLSETEEIDCQAWSEDEPDYSWLPNAGIRDVPVCEFILFLLNEHTGNQGRSCIIWENKETGLFRIRNTAQLALLWARVKHSQKVSWKKLHRALGYNCQPLSGEKEQRLYKVSSTKKKKDGSRSVTYQFNRNNDYINDRINSRTPERKKHLFVAFCSGKR